MARFYGNENFSLAVVKASQDRALLTYNRKHFLQLHRDSPTHAGIIVCTYDPDAVGQADKIHLAVKDVELSGRVLRIYREGFRLD